MKRPTEMCEKCDTYKKSGHNYCRICGFHIMKGFVQYGRIAEAYDTDEKFCGYCGDPRNNCKCLKKVDNNE